MIIALVKRAFLNTKPSEQALENFDWCEALGIGRQKESREFLFY